MSVTNELAEAVRSTVEAFRGPDPVTADERDALVHAFEETARWRREKAGEFPDDTRNLEAAELLDELAGTVRQVNKRLLLKYGEVMQDDRVSLSLGETQSELLREVGFRSAPTSAEKIVEQLLEKADELIADCDAE